MKLLSRRFTSVRQHRTLQVERQNTTSARILVLCAYSNRGRGLAKWRVGSNLYEDRLATAAIINPTALTSSNPRCGDTMVSPVDKVVTDFWHGASLLSPVQRSDASYFPNVLISQENDVALVFQVTTFWSSSCLCLHATRADPNLLVSNSD